MNLSFFQTIFNTVEQLLPFIIVVNILTQVSGLFIKGRAQMIFALVTGTVLGGLGWVAVNGFPSNFSGYVYAVTIGLGIGGGGVVFYDLLKGVVMKAFSQFITLREEQSAEELRRMPTESDGPFG